MSTRDNTYKDTIRLPSTGFEMKANLPAREPVMLRRWAEEDLAGAIRESRRGRRVFILHDGPPYANGSIHLGTAFNKVLKDFVVKSHTMLGMDCPFVPGWDCHGMPIEHKVASRSGGRADRAEIRRLCREYAGRFVEVQRGEFSRLGVFGEWDRPYLTMSPSYEAGIVRAFGLLVERGFIYQGLRPISWCTSCETALADAEVEYHPRTSPSVWVALEPAEPGEWAARGLPPAEVVVWTTTPWTLPANRAVAVNPGEEYTVVRARDRMLLVASRLAAAFAAETGCGGETGPAVPGSRLEGLLLRHPLENGRTVPVITAEHVTMDDGTGCVHTAPGHGLEDFAAGRRYSLETFSPVDGRGVFTSEAGPWEGMHVHDADPSIVEALRKSGRLIHSRAVEHSYPHCWRCRRPLIFRATSQFFLDLSRGGLKERVLSQVGGIGWVPSWGRDRMHNMMSARPDWCLSRQRSWGVALPALVCRACGKALLDPGIARGAAELIARSGSDAWFEMSAESVAAMSDSPARCPGCGSASFDRVDDILDVWFDSSLSHFNVLTGEYGLSRPADVYLEATDQHRGWFGVSMLTSEALGLGMPARTIITHGLILDGQGKKMSKSLGNAISPLEIIETMGADILRLWFASVDYTADFRADRAMLEDAREAYRKLRNTIRFMLGNLDGDCAGPFEATGLDRYMELRFREAQSACVEAYRGFQFHRVHKELRNLATTDLSGLFLDVRKDRLYCDPPDSPPARSTRALTGWMTVELLKLLAPIVPFTAEEAWLELPCTLRTTPSVHTAEFDVRPLSAPEREELEAWEPVLEVRRTVLKKLEEARASGLIGGSLEAHVSLTLPPGPVGSAGGEDWADLLIVSTVSVEAGDGVRAEVVVSPHPRCARCWRRTPEVPANDGEPLCPRCAGAVGAR